MSAKSPAERMREVGELLGEFGARLSGFDPGVSAYLPDSLLGLETRGDGYFGEQLTFSAQEWRWLEPLLVELAALRKERRP